MIYRTSDYIKFASKYTVLAYLILTFNNRIKFVSKREFTSGERGELFPITQP